MEIILSGRNTNSIYFKLCFILVSLFVIINGISPYNINKYFVLFVITIFISLLNCNELKKITYYILPLVTILHGYIILMILLLLIVKSKSLNKYQILPTILLLTIETIHFLTHGDLSSFSNFIYYSSCIALFFYILFDNKNDSIENISLFCYGTSLILFIVSYNMITTFGISDVLNGMHRDGSIMGSNEGENIIRVALNANSVGYLSIAVITLLFIGKEDLKIPSLIYVLLFAICIFAGIISFSRAWMIMILFSLIAYIFLKKDLISKKIFLIISVSLLALLVSSTEIIQIIYDSFYNRFIADDIETVGNRTSISNNYIEYLNNNKDAWIWGRGTIGSQSISNITVHNGTLQVIISYGIIGIFVYLLSFIMYFKKYNLNKVSKILYIPFIVCFIEIQTLQFLSPPFLMFPILVSLMALKTYKKHER